MFSFCLEEPCFPIFSFFVGLLFMRTTNIRPCCRRAPSDVYYHTASTAQCSQPAQAAKEVRPDQSATTQASRRNWLESACGRAFIQLAVFSNEQRNQNLLRLQKTYIHSQSILASVMREGFACTLLFFSILFISSMHAASNLFSYAMEILAFASRQFAPKIMDLSVCFIHSHFVL